MKLQKQFILLPYPLLYLDSLKIKYEKDYITVGFEYVFSTKSYLFTI